MSSMASEPQDADQNPPEPTSITFKGLPVQDSGEGIVVDWDDDGMKETPAEMRIKGKM